MAGIDKTYTDSYKDYSELKGWARGKVIKYWTGQEEEIVDYIYEWDEEDFNGRELPVMNTSQSVDLFLIQNCNLKFVQDRMREVYNKDTYEEFKTMKFPTEKPDGHERGRRVTINRLGRLPLYNKGINSHKSWWLQPHPDQDIYYDRTYRVWVTDLFLPFNSNTHTSSTIKSLIRHLRKQYLPVGAKFILSGRYIGEKFLVTIN